MAVENSSMVDRWSAASGAQKTGMIVGVMLIIAMTAILGIWSLDKKYQVLFSQLQEEDAAAIVEELRNNKTPYRLASDGTAILVPETLLHETRISLMAGGAPITGGVGFEIFDNQGLGATEQSQRVSYQRALQGELARTIGALDNVRRARVHLVLPESTLFKRDYQQPQAAVTLSLTNGAVLDRTQIAGIQRLVASSVANLAPAKVVITDQSGVTLSGAADISVASGTSDSRLMVKRETEEYVLRKIVGLLDQTYGPGKAIVSVDVTLNFDEVSRTVQGLGPPLDGVTGTAAGRRTDLEGDSPTGSAASSATGLLSKIVDVGGASTANGKYVGSVERVIAAPGSIERMSIGIIVPRYIDSEQKERIRQLVGVAAGLNDTRGDAIVVQTLEQVGSDYVRSTDAVVPDAVPDFGPAGATNADPQSASKPGVSLIAMDARLVIAAVGTVGLLVLLFFMRKRSATSLTKKERAQLLGEIKEALGDTDSPDYGTALS